MDFSSTRPTAAGRMKRTVSPSAFLSFPIASLSSPGLKRHDTGRPHALKSASRRSARPRSATPAFSERRAARIMPAATASPWVSSLWPPWQLSSWPSSPWQQWPSSCPSSPWQQPLFSLWPLLLSLSLWPSSRPQALLPQPQLRSS